MVTQFMSIAKNSLDHHGGEILKSAGKSSDLGNVLEFEGSSYKIPKSSALYTCNYSLSVVVALTHKPGYAVICEKLPVKRPRSKATHNATSGDDDKSVSGSQKSSKH
jgi:hypothetical protein